MQDQNFIVKLEQIFKKLICFFLFINKNQNKSFVLPLPNQFKQHLKLLAFI